MELKLFPDVAPESPDLAAGEGEAPISVHYEGPVSRLAKLLGIAARVNVILEAGTSATVKVSERNASWNTILKNALKPAGLAFRKDAGKFIRIAQAEKIQDLSPLPTTVLKSEPVSFLFESIDLADLIRFLEQMLEMDIQLPPGKHEPVTVVAYEMSAGEILNLIVASRKWTYTAEGKQIKIHSAP